VPDAVFEGDEEIELYEQYDGVILEPKEIAFVEAYCGDSRFNAASAYKMATGKDNRSQASKWMARPHIQAAIKFRLDAAGATTEAALAELSDVAFGEWRDFIDVKMRNGEVISTRMDLSSKVRALETIMRFYGKLDNKGGNQTAVVVNINTPGLSEDDLA
jgi:hypothetical protein